VAGAIAERFSVAGQGAGGSGALADEAGGVKRIAIVGAGCAGLSAAFTLEKQRKAGVEVDYTLFEASRRFGGVLATEMVDGCQVEAGPDSFLTEKPWASDFCRELGIGDQLVPSNDAARKTFIVVKGRLVVIPDGLMFMVPTKILPTVFSPLFSVGAKLRMAAEWFHPPRKAEADETVAAFVNRHYGPEMVDRLADPLLSGVYGGGANELSVRAALPRFAEMEAKYGSLGRAMLAARSKMARAAKGPPRPLFTALTGGMQAMADAAVARLNSANLKVDAPVQSVTPEAGGWVVSAGYATDHFDAVVIATPSQIAADLVHAANHDLAGELRGVMYTSSITVNLGYDGSVRKTLPPGFGFLVPRSEGTQMIAATFVHNKFPHRVPHDRALLRCFVGGSRNEGLLDAGDEEILNGVRGELAKIIGLNAEPRFGRVHRWRRAMAQYGVGHLDRLVRIDNLLQQLPGLALAGNGYRGIGVPDCIRTGTEAAMKSLITLGVPMSVPQPIPAKI
jgi:protoporphyrinogen/coproporphyrinogen III oxidase